MIYVIDLKSVNERLKKVNERLNKVNERQIEEDEQTEDNLTITLKENQIDKIELHEEFRFINFIDIGKGKEAMLLEHKTSNELRFFTSAFKNEKIYFI